MDKLIAAWQATSNLELVSVVFGLAYVVLAARENSWCWPCAFIGTATAAILFWEGLLPMEAALNVYYLAMAIYGWWQWRGGTLDGNPAQSLKISSWRLQNHAACIAVVAILTIISGYLLSRYTQAVLPYLDSFTTWSAVITTWMVTRKILENWLYWLVINSASIYLYLEREFYLYAALFVIYLIIALYGYIQWRKQWRKHSIHA
ncbi:MAG: nicotinamide riboside transporter PnuC [Gammaproteobacteria bacterium]|nr:nicotinamide riboside transporter PnuC [Gammaproteobacteria bacterium]